jgi:diaminopimelate decarboxylase
MAGFIYRDGTLYCEDVSLEQIAHEVGTPFYVYSSNEIKDNFNRFYNAFDGLNRIVCFAVKACSNIGILALLAKQGSGADIVSGGELYRSVRAGVKPDKIVFAGVGKSAEEIKSALDAGILMFDVESRQEMELINKVALENGKVARIAIRINPNVDPKTHPYISTGLKKSKFGIPIESVKEDYRFAASLEGIRPMGAHFHIGSQITEVSPFADAARIIISLIKELRQEGIDIKYLDLGGGLGIKYEGENPPSYEEYADAVKDAVKGEDLTLIFEPGRSITGNAGVLVSEVLYTKESGDKEFKIVDAAMNDLSRPSLYGAYHDVKPVKEGVGNVFGDVVGPVCESGDFLAKDREIPDVKQGDLIAVMSSGAYGMTMASNYNSRRRVPEILVSGSEYNIIRRRETFEDLVGPESIPPFLR